MEVKRRKDGCCCMCTFIISNVTVSVCVSDRTTCIVYFLSWDEEILFAFKL